MVNEQVRIGTLILNVVCEHLRVCGFEPDKRYEHRRLQGWPNATHMILSAGNDEVTAEMTSVRHDFTFSVIPSLSIMIICEMKLSNRTDLRGSEAYMCTRVEERIGTVD